MKIEKYNYLPPDAVRIRTEVFIKEQGFSAEAELDKFDTVATHMVGYVNKTPVATARFFFDEKRGAVLIGRIAVLKKQRHKGFGAEIVAACEKSISKDGYSHVIIHAQLQAKGFYESIGYASAGDIDYEEGVPHILMKKLLP